MQILYEVIEILGCLFSYWFILFTTNIFYNYKNKSFKKLSLALSVVYLPLTYDLIMPFSGTAASLLAMLFVYIVVCICFDGNLAIKAFIVLIYNIFSVCISNLYFALFSYGFQISISELTSQRSLLRASIILSLYLIEMVILLITEKIVKKDSVGHYGILELAITFLFLLIDFAFSVFSYIILHFHSDGSAIAWLVCCLMSILCVVCTLIALYLMKKLKEQYTHNLDNIAIKMQLDNMNKYITDTQNASLEIIALRHDMKNKLLAYSSLLEGDNTSDVISDIKETLELPSLSEPLAYCANTAFNTLIFNKVQSAKDSDIDFHCRITLADNYRNLKLMVALSNLIDNAIEHEQIEPKALRSIKLSLVQDAAGINIVLENFISESVLQDNPELLSTKGNNQNHGFGIKNVRQLVEMIGGVIEFTKDGNSFFAQIVI